jgi:hypothetical protein
MKLDSEKGKAQKHYSEWWMRKMFDIVRERSGVDAPPVKIEGFEVTPVAGSINQAPGENRQEKAPEEDH